MELLLISSLPFFLTFLLFLYMIKKYNMISSSYAKNRPPGPYKLPLIGNLHQLAFGPLHRTICDMANKHGPIMHLQLGEVSAVVISSPEAAKEVLKTYDITFADRPRMLFAQIVSFNYINVVFSPYGDYWKELRKICMLELLSTKRVRAYRLIREEEGNKIIKSIMSSPGVPVNLTEKISSMITDVTCRAAYGSKYKDKNTFISAVKEAGKLATNIYLPDVFPSLKFLHPISKESTMVLEKIKLRVDKLLNSIIDDHIAKRERLLPRLESGEKEEHEEKDLVDVLLEIQQSSQPEFLFARDNIKAVVLDIFSAGIETSSTTAEWAMSEMIKNPRVMEKAQAEVRSIAIGKHNFDETNIQQLNYLKLVIKETLRLHPPLPLSLPREARETSKVSGYDIPAKTMVIVNVRAIGRDPSYWKNAECFEPERFDGSQINFKGLNFEYIPFGAGRRICPGISFSIATIELLLAQLLFHFDWKLPNETKTEDFDMMEDGGVNVARKNPLYLIGTPYTPE